MFIVKGSKIITHETKG